MLDLRAVADAADMIINGYAFTKDGAFIKVLNLHHPDKAAVLNETGDVMETSMDDIELQIVVAYLLQNLQFVED